MTLPRVFKEQSSNPSDGQRKHHGKSSNRFALYLVLLLFLIAFILGGWMILAEKQVLPRIHGVIIPESRPLASFVLVDHDSNAFSNARLSGKWHLVSYGYSHCPDVCPNTLNILARVKRQLESQDASDQLQVVFYSIDHQRDTSAHLNQYMPFFHPDFIGLTYNDANQSAALPFETSLGLKSELTPLPAEQQTLYTGTYSVAHGVMLYLLNPEGELQAVFKPQRDEMGLQHFTEAQVLKDYLAVRNHFSNSTAKDADSRSD